MEQPLPSALTDRTVARTVVRGADGQRSSSFAFAEESRGPLLGTMPATSVPMTAPRQILFGTTSLVTRRCAQRQFLLRPSRTTNEVFRFLLGVTSKRYGIRLHAYCVLSNHYHLVLTDPDGHLPAFQRDLNGLLARALNASVAHWEDFWAPPSYSAVSLLTAADVLDKVAYTLANPVAAKLVRSARQWPGLWSAPEAIGAPPLRLKRPSHFFDPEGPLPETATLELTVPAGFESAEEFRARLVAALAHRESEAVRCASGFLGVLKVLAQRPMDRPRRHEPRRRLRPRVASRDKWRRIEALGKLKEFVSDYRRALESWRAGSDAVFPAGTYHMRVLHGAACLAGG